MIAYVLQGKTVTGEPLPRGEKTGKQVMDEIRILIDEVVTVEENLLVAREQQNVAAVGLSEGVTLWGSLFAALLALALGILLTRRLVGQLGAEPNALRAISENVAVGILSQTLPEQTGGGRRSVATSINRMIEAFRETALQADAIALGDFSVDIQPRGDEDQLGLALKRMTKTLRGVVTQANLIAQGDYSQQLEIKGENDELGRALNTMAANLKRAFEENERAQWLKNGQAEAAVAMRGDKDLAALSSSIVTFLGRYLEVPVGALYVSNGTRALKLMGSFGFHHRKHQGESIEPGSGVLGQAVLEQKTMVVSGIPENYISITSGLGKDSATQALVSPIAKDGVVVGAVEFGSFVPFTELQREFLDQVCDAIAIAITSSKEAEATRELLKETQRQSEELQAQQEEMAAQNEELREQTDALKKSRERLAEQSEELRASNEELEEQTESLWRQNDEIEQRNKQVEQAKREIEKKAGELEQASKYKSEFLANMSHELRTPLNSLLILSESLAKNKTGNLTPEQVEKAQVIHGGGVDLLRLINDILDLSKVEAGKLDVHNEETSLADLLSHLRRQFTPIAKDKGLELLLDLDPWAPETIYTDGQRVEQILRNLASNAFKFTEKGSVVIRVHLPQPTVQLRSGLATDQAVAFSVTDTGIGIPEDKQQSIFEAQQARR